jgi:hypothetical protein
MKASWFTTRAASKDPRVMTLACFSCMWGACPLLMGANRTQLPIAILLCVAFALPAGLVRADENHKPARTWKVKESQDVPSNERRSLSLTPNTLDEETTDGVVESIPFADIIGLAHSVRDRRPVREAKRKMHKDNYDPENIKEAIAEDPRVIIGVPFIPVMDAAEQLALTPFQGIKSHWHFVYIHWERDGEEHFETFRLRRKSALSLLAELQRATGKDVDTLDFSENVDLRYANRILLNFNESVWVGSTLLSPGRYTVMLIKRSENLGVLYFLPGEEMDPQQLSAKIAVKILPLASDQLKIPVVDRDAEYILHLRELRPRTMEVRLILDSPN